MGCCCSGYDPNKPDEEILADREKQLQRLLQMSSDIAKQPIQTPDGFTVIPMNSATGEFPSIYPQWISENISQNEYMAIIQKLNDCSIPIYSSSEQLQQKLHIANYKRQRDIQQSCMQEMQQMQSNFVIKMNGICTNINESVLYSKGMRMTNSFEQYKNAKVIIKWKTMHVNGRLVHRQMPIEYINKPTTPYVGVFINTGVPTTSS
eukprot:458269_1